MTRHRGWMACSALILSALFGSSAAAAPGAEVTRARDGRSGVVAKARSFIPPSAPSRTAGPSSAAPVAPDGAPHAVPASSESAPVPTVSVAASSPFVIDPGTPCPALYATGSEEPFTSVPETRAAQCVYAPPSTDGEQEAAVLPDPLTLARIATDRALAFAPRPRLEIAPGRRGLTGLPTFVWLRDEPTSISATAGVPGLVVTAEARPVEFVWSFGDGADTVTDHSGRPWHRRNPGDISHVYEKRGRYAVEVEVVWQARWRAGDGAWNHLGYFSDADGRRYRVREIVGALVRPR